MDNTLEQYLENALEKLEKARIQLEEGFGFCTSSEEIRILEEMIKEQTPNENFSHSTSSPG